MQIVLLNNNLKWGDQGYWLSQYEDSIPSFSVFLWVAKFGVVADSGTFKWVGNQFSASRMIKGGTNIAINGSCIFGDSGLPSGVEYDMVGSGKRHVSVKYLNHDAFTKLPVHFLMSFSGDLSATEFEYVEIKLSDRRDVVLDEKNFWPRGVSVNPSVMVLRFSPGVKVVSRDGRETIDNYAEESGFRRLPCILLIIFGVLSLGLIYKFCPRNRKAT